MDMVKPQTIVPQETWIVKPARPVAVREDSFFLRFSGGRSLAPDACELYSEPSSAIMNPVPQGADSFGPPGGNGLKKTTKVILCAACALALAAATLGAVRICRHETDQDEALRELSKQVTALREKRQASAEKRAAADEAAAGLERRVTCLEVRAERMDADYTWFAIGNSITVHAPNEVWWNEIGMAASTEDRDYVHLAAEQLSGLYGKTAVHPLYCYAWETAEDRSAKLFMLDPYLDPQLQLVTIQLGENAKDLTTFGRDFEALIRYVQEKAPQARILVIGGFWSSGDRDRMKQEAAEKTGAGFVSLEEIRDNPEYQAGIGAVVYDAEGTPHTVENADVAGHPGDRGMQYIADRVVETLKGEP